MSDVTQESDGGLNILVVLVVERRWQSYCQVKMKTFEFIKLNIIINQSISSYS